MQDLYSFSSPDCLAPSRWREEVERKWPHGSILYGDGQYACLSWCRGSPLVSLHPTKDQAKETKTRLDQEGCCRGCFAAYPQRLTHEVIDLETGKRWRS